MSLINTNKNGYKDVFKGFLVKNARFSGKLEIPCIDAGLHLPNKLLPFSKALNCQNYEQWVHFYEDDYVFERVWNQPNKYLPILKRYKGVISPDFSLYRDMPLVMQQWNTYRNRAIGHWLQLNGIPVIPNVRFSDERSFEFCCEGLSLGGTIAVGSYGCIKHKLEREYFKKGLEFVFNKLQPQIIVVYGSTPDVIFAKYKIMEINILQFDSNFAQSRKAVVL